MSNLIRSKDILDPSNKNPAARGTVQVKQETVDTEVLLQHARVFYPQPSNAFARNANSDIVAAAGVNAGVHVTTAPHTGILDRASRLPVKFAVRATGTLCKTRSSSDPQLPASSAAYTGARAKTEESLDIPLPVTPAKHSRKRVKTEESLDILLPATPAKHTPIRVKTEESLDIPLPVLPAEHSRIRVRKEGLLDPQLIVSSAAQTGTPGKTAGSWDSQRRVNSATRTGLKGQRVEFPCPMCDQSFCKVKALRGHIKRWHNPEVSKCPKCFLMTYSKDDRIDHMRNHLDGTPYGCKCGAAFPTLWALTRHSNGVCPLKKRKFRNERMWCVPCGQRFETPRLLQKHLFTCSPVPGTQEALEKTSREGADSIGSEVVFQPTHGSLGAQQDVQGKRNAIDSDDSLETPCVLDLQPSGKVAAKRPGNVCTEQPFLKKPRFSAFGEAETLASEDQSEHVGGSGLPRVEKELPSTSGHVKLHKRNRVVCAPCNMSFDRHRFSRHNSRFHNSTATKCPKCNKLCPSESNRIEHMRTHSNQKPYACLCQAAFNSILRLCLHVKHECLSPRRSDEMGRGPWMCRLCGECFSKPLQLREHLRTCSPVPSL